MAIESDYIPSTYTADESTLTKSANQFSVKALGVGTAQLANASVTQAKLSNINHLQLVSSQTLGANATTVDFSSLDFNTDGEYFFEAYIINTAANSVRLYVNNDTTDANYSTENFTAVSTTLAGSTSAAPIAATTQGGATSKWWLRGRAFLVDGYFSFESESNRGHNSNGYEKHTGHKSSASVANITQLTFSHASANGFGTGSIFKIYKIV